MTAYPPYDPRLSYQSPFLHAPNPRPASVTALSIIGIILGSIGSLNHAAGLALMGFGSTLSEIPAEIRGWSVADSTISLAFAGTLLTGSIGALRLRPWARKLLLGWVVGYLIWLCVCLSVAVSWTLPVMVKHLQSSMPRYQRASMQEGQRIGAYVGGIGVLVGAMVFPLVLLAFLRKPNVRAAFGETVAGHPPGGYPPGGYGGGYGAPGYPPGGQGYPPSPGGYPSTGYPQDSPPPPPGYR